MLPLAPQANVASYILTVGVHWQLSEHWNTVWSAWALAQSSQKLIYNSIPSLKHQFKNLTMSPIPNLKPESKPSFETVTLPWSPISKM